MSSQSLTVWFAVHQVQGWRSWRGLRCEQIRRCAGGARRCRFRPQRVPITAAVAGFPSVGKSTLLNVLTSTFSEAAAYEFTTLTCIPGQLALHGALGVTLRVSGVIQYKGAKIQLLDLPGIIEGAKDGKGRGRQVISTARTCNLIIIVLDVSRPLTHKRLIEKELEGFGIRLNKVTSLV